MALKTIVEIEEMLIWLDRQIKDWESDISRRGSNDAIDSTTCRSFRNDYAGWLAERDFLRRLKVRVLNDKVWQGLKN